MTPSEDNAREKRLISAASSGHINVLGKMLKKGGLNLDFQGDEKDLHFWSDGVLRAKNWRETQPPARLLGKSGNTALMWACQLHRTKVAEALLDAGASPKVRNLIDETALHLLDDHAAYLVDRMVEAGADVNARNKWGATPLMMALAMHRLSVALKLLENGADPQIKTPGGLDAYAIAEKEGIDPVFVAHMKSMQEKIDYICHLKGHDWYYQYSDDGRVWRAGQASYDALHKEQQKLDPDYQLWNKYAPEPYRQAAASAGAAALKGKLVAFSEQGSEGTHWGFQEEGKEGYDGLHILKKGDMLKVFNDAAGKKKIWKGRIDLDFNKNRRPLPLMPSLVVQWIESVGTVHGIQKGVAPKKWAKMFLDEKPAQLMLHVPPKKPKAP